MIDTHEKALAETDKYKKKRLGQYYTPEDVADLMSGWLSPLPGYNLCDVGCGTGRLILAYLRRIGKEHAKELVSSGRIYLYDLDETALDICVKSIKEEFGEGEIHTFLGDFLSRSIALPDDCKVISNPPYASYTELGVDWDKTDVQIATKDYYTAFMEKILLGSRTSVIITPYSFISSEKFYAIREVLDGCGGDIYVFDNVPGNIFNGRKQGIFNTNLKNSVRAAITVTKEINERGYRVTPLIRFKTDEREKVLDPHTLKTYLPRQRQRINEENPCYYKCFPQLVPVYKRWLHYAENHTLKELLGDGYYHLSFPKTCRYYTTAATKLNRKGQIQLSFSSPDDFYFAYCLLNSSFAYWYWRMFDGGINYTKSLLLSLPILTHRFTENERGFFRSMAGVMIQSEQGYMVKTINVGEQENIKFPQQYRDTINQRILAILGLDLDASVFNQVHTNSIS